jgi:hypothetical protein
MTTTTTTTTTTDAAPHLGEPILALFQREELFAGVSQASAWLAEFGDKVLKEAAYEAVQNLLSASSDERRNRGLMTLERAILAQAAWLQLFELMAPVGRFDQLKELTNAVRDRSASSEEHQTARTAVLAAFEEYSERRGEADELIAQITDLASEEALVWAARTGSVTGNRGQSMGLYPWMVECLDEVLAGRGYRAALKSLRLTAERLALLSRIFFGETATSNGGGKAKKAKPASKVRAQLRGIEERKRRENDPNRGRGYVKEGGIPSKKK